MLSMPTLARASVLSVFAITAMLSAGCGSKSRAEGAQAPPPPSLAEPVRPAPAQTQTANVVPADEYKFLENRQVGHSTPLPSVPADAPKAEVTTTTDASGKVYVMQKGDTLYGIARKFNVPPKQLIAANNFPDPNKVNVGTKVRIP